MAISTIWRFFKRHGIMRDQELGPALHRRQALLVEDAVADRFAAMVAHKGARHPLRRPLDPEKDLGTVINEDAAKLFETRVARAVEEGAKVL